MRSNVGIQTAPAAGAFVWSSGAGSGGNVGMQQPAEIAGRNGNEAGTVSIGCDGDGAEWSGVKREPDTERLTVAESRLNFGCTAKIRSSLRASAFPEPPSPMCLVWELHPSRQGAKAPEAASPG
jgi:hypothetical protein